MSLTLKHTGNGLTAIEGVLDIQRVSDLRTTLAQHPGALWDLTSASELDSAAAFVLLRHWDGQVPVGTAVTERQRLIFDRIRAAPVGVREGEPLRPPSRPKGSYLTGFRVTAIGLLTLLGQCLLDLLFFIRHPRTLPLREISAACYRSGVSALAITTIVGFLIGIVLSYLSSLSLRDFGAESFLPLVMGVGIVRELGPLLTAIVLAGRSGSAITAGLAAMRLTQEVDALTMLGVSHSRRLVVPRVLALIVMTPLLTTFTNVAALAGGMLAGWVELNLVPAAFVIGLRNDVPLTDLSIGLFKSAVFGGTVAIVACYYGLSSIANTQSLATNTTKSVVLSISLIILIDAFFAIVLKDV